MGSSEGTGATNRVVFVMLIPIRPLEGGTHRSANNTAKDDGVQHSHTSREGNKQLYAHMQSEGSE
jgi:hypothetical protein